MIALKRTTAPTEQPVLLEELKDHLRVDGSDDDAYLHSLIYAATEYVEGVVGRSMVTQTWTLGLDSFPVGNTIWLYKPPLVSVTSLKYTNSAGDQTTFSSDNYHVDTLSEPGRIVLKHNVSWPSATLQTANAVEIIYVAGSARNLVPEKLRHAVKFLAAHWYENRETVTDAKLSDAPLAVESLIASEKVHWP